MSLSHAAATLLLLLPLLLLATAIADTDDNSVVDQYRSTYNASAHWELINEVFQDLDHSYE